MDWSVCCRQFRDSGEVKSFKQPTTMNMDGGMLGNVQHPMGNFGHGNNMNFFGANMRNNMGYDRGNGNVNNA